MRYNSDSFPDRTYVDRWGYLRFRDTGKLVHRKVAEEMLGRALGEGDVVRHINRNRLDNRSENLYVLSSRR
jgi:hypothetical protein